MSDVNVYLFSVRVLWGEFPLCLGSVSGCVLLCRGIVDFSCLGVSVTFDKAKLMLELS